MYHVQLVERLDIEPITLAQAKSDLKLDLSATDEDNFIMALISAAREYAEEYTGLTIVPTRYKLHLDGFHRNIFLPKGNVTAVESIEYTDTAGDTQTLSADNYSVMLYGIPAHVLISEGPSVKSNTLGTVVITYAAGYSSYGTSGEGEGESPTTEEIRAAIPKRAMQAMSLLLANWYQNREDFYTEREQAPRAARLLLRTLRTQHFYQNNNTTL
jgi:uncharacterized phiE125 gp8 family phage protein